QEGVSGLRQRFTKAKGLYAARPTYAFPCAEFLTGISRQAHEVLAPRVLIIAELSIPQCTKYRVTQKKEMIQHLGLECEVLSWTEPAQCLRALSTFSMVIFYRVPAFQSVINIMDEARRLNLMTYWEVDDLIFDREVLQTSRTLARLEPQVFQQILDGADLYRSAMARCARGIASTTGLAAAMQAEGLVDTFVVENALDKETVAVANRINNAGHIRDDSVVRIVYGSGTNTHNEDFAVVAPVLIDIFQKYPQVHFRLIGKLDLPREFE